MIIVVTPRPGGPGPAGGTDRVRPRGPGPAAGCRRPTEVGARPATPPTWDPSGPPGSDRPAAASRNTTHHVVVGASQAQNLAPPPLCADLGAAGCLGAAGRAAVSGFGLLPAAVVQTRKKAAGRSPPPLPHPGATDRRCRAAGETDRGTAVQLASLLHRAGDARDRGGKRQQACTTIRSRGPRESKGSHRPVTTGVCLPRAR